MSWRVILVRKFIGRRGASSVAGNTCHGRLPLVTASASTVTVTLTFSLPVIVSGNIPLNLSGSQTLVSQTITSATVVTQVYSATVVGDTWSIGSGAPVATYQGGTLAPASGTF